MLTRSIEATNIKIKVEELELLRLAKTKEESFEKLIEFLRRAKMIGFDLAKRTTAAKYALGKPVDKDDLEALFPIEKTPVKDIPKRQEVEEAIFLAKKENVLSYFNYLFTLAKRNHSLFETYRDLFCFFSSPVAVDGTLGYSKYRENLKKDQARFDLKLANFLIEFGNGRITNMSSLFTHFPIVNYNESDIPSLVRFYESLDTSTGLYGEYKYDSSLSSIANFYKGAVETKYTEGEVPKNTIPEWKSFYESLGLTSTTGARIFYIVRELSSSGVKHLLSSECTTISKEKKNELRMLYQMHKFKPSVPDRKKKEEDKKKENKDDNKPKEKKQPTPFELLGNIINENVSVILSDKPMLINDPEHPEKTFDDKARDFVIKKLKSNNKITYTSKDGCSNIVNGKIYYGIVIYMAAKEIPLKERIFDGFVKDYSQGEFELPKSLLELLPDIEVPKESTNDKDNNHANNGLPSFLKTLQKEPLTGNNQNYHYGREIFRDRQGTNSTKY